MKRAKQVCQQKANKRSSDRLLGKRARESNLVVERRGLQYVCLRKASGFLGMGGTDGALDGLCKLTKA